MTNKGSASGLFLLQQQVNTMSAELDALTAQVATNTKAIADLTAAYNANKPVATGAQLDALTAQIKADDDAIEVLLHPPTPLG